MLLSLFNNFDYKSFISGLGIGSICGYAIKIYINKLINRQFSREDIAYDKLQERYTKLYIPLKQIILGISIESMGKLTFNRRMNLVVKGVFKGKFNYAWNYLKLKDTTNPNDKYLAEFSNFNFESLNMHINKYFKLADDKLIKLLDRVIRSENIETYYRNLEGSRGIQHFDDGYLTPEKYQLINHIDKYSEYLCKKLNPK